MTEMNSEQAVIPLAQPKLPTTRDLLPYLERIDESGWYTNHGPLEEEFRRRVATEIGCGPDNIATASSATAALIATLQAVTKAAKPQQQKVIVPNLTFVATGLAVMQAGYVPVLAEVTGPDWQLDPTDIADYEDLESVAAVMPVGAFGTGVSQKPWQDFTTTTGIPVIIDLAAGWEPLTITPDRHFGPIPTVVSLHATKTFAAGEGGFVACGDEQLTEDIERWLNFGFHGSRLATVAGFNGKLSEYHCAVGLASLDDLPDSIRAFNDVAAVYEDVLADLAEDSLITAPAVASCYAMLKAPTHAVLDQWRQGFTDRSIETKAWYGQGLSGHPVFANAPHFGDVTVPALLGLPMSPRFTDQTAHRVANAAQEILESQKQRTGSAIQPETSSPPRREPDRTRND